MKVSCTNCKYYHTRYSVYELQCWSKPNFYKYWNQHQLWLREGQPEYINKNNDCPHYKPKLIQRIKEFIELIFPVYEPLKLKKRG